MVLLLVGLFQELPNPIGGLSSAVLEIGSFVTSVDQKDDNLFGSGEVDCALIRQWLEYASLYRPYINKSPVVANQVLKVHFF